MSSWVGSQLLLHQAAQVKRGMHAFSLVWNILIFLGTIFVVWSMQKGLIWHVQKELTHILVLLFSQNVSESIDSF
jgi:hypothetical protein